jgi:hypothetical protein
LLDMATFVYLAKGSFVNKKLYKDKKSKPPIAKNSLSCTKGTHQNLNNR